jgi:phosphate transport system protein
MPVSRSQEHTYKQYDEELRLLKDKILLMGQTVQEHLAGTMRALYERDAAAAEKLMRSDWRVNILEMECDQQCVRMIALRQPAASDLRFLFGALKIDTDLERIGDLVVNIAERVHWLAASPLHQPALDLSPLAATVQELLRDTLDSFVRSDPASAQQVLQRDAPIDRLFADIFDRLVVAIKSDPASIERAMRLLFIAKHLERIADHATNIAEMVVYMVHGKDVRHRWSPPRT